jgi:hypothetical protein
LRWNLGFDLRDISRFTLTKSVTQFYPFFSSRIGSVNNIDIHKQKRGTLNLEEIGLVYRFEIHLPDTQNVDTFRAIFKAMREELMQ